MQFSFKVFRDSYILLAIADKDIVGKTFKSNDLEIFITKDFYHEDFCDDKKALELIKQATIVNAMGKNIIDLLVKEDFVKRENVLKPCGVPHVQIVNM